MSETTLSCPCGSGNLLAACCGRWLAGEHAPTAEQLMRARYSAYVLGETAFLLASWHPSTRPADLQPVAGPAWCGLQVLSTTAGQASDSEGTVEFVARYREGARLGALHETSRFVREKGRWYYLDGQLHPTAPTKTGRNDPCPCGSGRKFKHCCA